jgi:hypothetical protein
MDSFFQFRAHGTTPRIVSYVLLKFGVVPSTFEASAGDGAAACDAMWKSRVEPQKISPAWCTHISPPSNGTRKSYTMFALHERRGVHPRARKANEKIERLHSEDALYVREPSGNISAPSLLCFPPLSHVFHHATPSSARISTPPLTRRSFLSSHPPSF